MTTLAIWRKSANFVISHSIFSSCNKISVQFSCSVVSDSLRPYEPQHARPPYPSPPGVYSNSCPSSQWCHPTISSSVVPFSSCPPSLQASGSFPMSQLFAWCGQSIGVSASASVLPMNTQDWSLGWTGWIWQNLKHIYLTAKLCGSLFVLLHVWENFLFSGVEFFIIIFLLCFESF